MLPFYCLVVGAIVAAAISRHKEPVAGAHWVLFLPLPSAFCILAIYVFRQRGNVTSLSLSAFIPGWAPSLSIGIDPLSALLLLIISIISFCATLFSIRYIRRYEKESLLRYYPLLLLLFASIVGVVVMQGHAFLHRLLGDDDLNLLGTGCL